MADHQTIGPSETITTSSFLRSRRHYCREFAATSNVPSQLGAIFLFSVEWSTTWPHSGHDRMKPPGLSPSSSAARPSLAFPPPPVPPSLLVSRTRSFCSAVEPSEAWKGNGCTSQAGDVTRSMYRSKVVCHGYWMHTGADPWVKSNIVPRMRKRMRMRMLQPLIVVGWHLVQRCWDLKSRPVGGMSAEEAASFQTARMRAHLPGPISSAQRSSRHMTHLAFAFTFAFALGGSLNLGLQCRASTRLGGDSSDRQGHSRLWGCDRKGKDLGTTVHLLPFIVPCSRMQASTDDITPKLDANPNIKGREAYGAHQRSRICKDASLDESQLARDCALCRLRRTQNFLLRTLRTLKNAGILVLESWGPTILCCSAADIPLDALRMVSCPRKAFSCGGCSENALDAAESEGEPGLIGKADCVTMLHTTMPTVTAVTGWNLA